MIFYSRQYPTKNTVRVPGIKEVWMTRWDDSIYTDFPLSMVAEDANFTKIQTFELPLDKWRSIDSSGSKRKRWSVQKQLRDVRGTPTFEWTLTLETRGENLESMLNLKAWADNSMYIIWVDNDDRAWTVPLYSIDQRLWRLRTMQHDSGDDRMTVSWTVMGPDRVEVVNFREYVESYCESISDATLGGDWEALEQMEVNIQEIADCIVDDFN